MAFNFSGKKVLVTGAGRGIGRGIALALVKAGCQVYALDCVQENLDKLAAEDSNIVTICQDLSDWESTRAVLESLEAMDGLVNNAGIVNYGIPALDVARKDIEVVLSVNLYATINCIQVIGKKMVEAGKGGSIVNISSDLAILALRLCLAYDVSKAGVDMVTKQFALELGPHNIRVNSVNPTLVNTGILSDGDFKKLKALKVERTPLSRIAEIAEIVGPVLYLLSDYSSMVTGTTHMIDGGLSCNITTKS